MKVLLGDWLGTRHKYLPESAIQDSVSCDKTFIVHFRNVISPLPIFTEQFIDDFYQDINILMNLFYKTGYSGTMILDHSPPMAAAKVPPETNTSQGNKVATAYAIGYMKALLAATSR